MKLLGRVRDLRQRYELLFQHPTPEVAQRHTDAFELLERWLERPSIHPRGVRADAVGG